MGYDHTIVSIHAYLRHAGSFVLEANHESFTEKLRGLAQQRYRRKVACLVMISSLAWVPAGVAASTPVKYEMSPAEKELIELMQKQGNLGDLEVEQEQESTKAKAPTKPKVDHHGLPDDLRMDEYSSDEDEEGVTIGNLLVGQSSPTSMEEEEEDSQADQAGEELQNDRSDDSDDDDDLADVPDTREFEPVSVEAVEALGLSHVGTNSATHMGDDDEDDDSDIEDVRIGPDDALVVVAKTEEVCTLGRDSVSVSVAARRHSSSSLTVRTFASICRILLASKCTVMIQRLEIYTFTMIFHCLHFHCASLMVKFRATGRVTSVLLGLLARASKYGILMC